MLGVDDNRQILGIQGNEFELMDSIVSPGGLPNGLLLENALQGRSEIRNKVIARVFYELDYIEQWGSGIARIQRLCKEADSPEPIFSETGDFFDIEFPRIEPPENLEEGGQIGGSIGGSIEGLTERQQEILRLLKDNPKVSYRNLAKKLEINDSAIKNT